MPRRNARSKAAKLASITRKSSKNADQITSMPRSKIKARVELASTSEKIPVFQKSNIPNRNRESQVIQSITNVTCIDDVVFSRRVRGRFDQGDIQFSEESRGRQCPCNSLVMLCEIDELFDTMLPNDIDDVLRNGDGLYNIIASKLEAKDELNTEDGYLEIEQLPTTFALDNRIYNVQYDTSVTGRIASTPVVPLNH